MTARTPTHRAGRREIWKFHARLMAAVANSTDSRLERIFELVPREAFLGPGPWQIAVAGCYFETPSADPAYLYHNVLVALDAAKSINNGEPYLHAAWIGAAAPKAGEKICHIGAGTGYYSALLSLLALPEGRVEAFEIEPHLAARARENLRPFENTVVREADATSVPLPPSDLIYVNAGVVVPPHGWLRALRVGGRMIFPWRPTPKIGLAVLLTRHAHGIEVRPLMPSWFIPCIGASDAGVSVKVPDGPGAWSARSLWLSEDRPPDETAVAVYEHAWLSSEPLLVP